MSALAAPPSFRTPEGLRALLERLHGEGDSAWRRNVDVTALMEYTAGRYASLARKHGLDPWEAASAAFDAMRTPAVRTADDPWAVITRAVQVTLIAEERGNGCRSRQWMPFFSRRLMSRQTSGSSGGQLSRSSSRALVLSVGLTESEFVAERIDDGHGRAAWGVTVDSGTL